MRSDEDLDWRVRQAAFAFLQAQTLRQGEVLSWQTLTKGFTYDGHVVPLLGAAGIWKPRLLDLPISITTTPSDEDDAPYEDGVRDDGLLVYRYQGDDPNNHFNAGLRNAAELGRPLIYFLGVVKGRYRPFWPAIIAEDHPADLHVAVELYEGAVPAFDLAELPAGSELPTKSYARRLTLQRLHQPAFRERVLRAYRNCCAICRLKHAELLDAAHILPDTHPKGAPVVTNGLALCKIHHAAFDRHILGIRPDFVIEVRHDILDEVDGPMLRHGLQEVHGGALILPRRTEDRPSTELLEERYEAFREAS